METTANLTRIQEATQEDSQSFPLGIGGCYTPSKEKLLVFVQRALLLKEFPQVPGAHSLVILEVFMLPRDTEPPRVSRPV